MSGCAIVTSACNMRGGEPLDTAEAWAAAAVLQSLQGEAQSGTMETDNKERM